MSETVKLLNCPSCGASLPPTAGQTVMQCPYCHNTVEISSGSPVQAKAEQEDREDDERVDLAPSAAQSAAGSPFHMIVEDIFSIKGRGIVATGRIQSGRLRAGDRVRIRRAEGSGKTASVSGVEMFHRELTEAKAGDNVGVLLKDLAKNDLQQGDVLEAA